MSEINKTNKWFCDVCGKPITKVEDGWIEWITYTDKEGNGLARDFRLVHHRSASPLKSFDGCHFNEQEEIRKDGGGLSDLPLEYFLGIDGLMLLLSKIAEGAIPTDQLLEMIKRLQIPGYEIARRHFDRALRKGIIEQEMYPGHYTQEQISIVIDQGWPDNISDLRTYKPNLNFNEGFSMDDLRQLLSSVDDMEGHHIIWVDYDGKVDITLISEEFSPAGWAASMKGKLKFRYETCQRGNEYVGFEAARNDAYVTDLYNSLIKDWETNRIGYLDY